MTTMYVIQRTDQGGGFVTKEGSQHSYTRNILKARTFTSREAAAANICPDNEIVVTVDQLMTG